MLLFITFFVNLILGGLIGYLAWIVGFLPFALLLFFFQRRMFFAALGYYGVSSIGVIFGTGNFFGYSSSLALGVLFWLVITLILSSPFLIFDFFRKGILRNIFILVLIELILVLPPIGLIGWANPVYGFFALFQLNDLPFIFAVIALYLFLYGVTKSKYSVIVLFLLLIPVFVQSTFRDSLDIEAIQTHYSKQKTDLQGFLRAVQLLHMIEKNRHKVVLTPELDIGVWYVGTARVFQPLLKENKIVLVGTALPEGRQLEDGFMLITKNREKFYSDSIPVPYSMWHPYDVYHNYKMNLFNPEILYIKKNRVGYLVCYEQLLAFEAFKMIYERPQYLLGLSNDWWSPSLVKRQQKMALGALAHFLGVNYSDAINS